MGYGDEILSSGLARGMHARGKLAAFGDGRQIVWSRWSEEVFRHNPNIAKPGDEGASDIEWIPFYKGNRGYHLGMTPTNWIYNMQFRPVPGQIFFDQHETEMARMFNSGFVLIEPNVPHHKTWAANKQWPAERFQQVADGLQGVGYRVVQLIYKDARTVLRDVDHIHTKTFREALGILSRAALFIGGEGGLHHGAAALGVPAVVLFGGYTPIELTGYPPLHVNLKGDSVTACGSLRTCDHCIAAMDSIATKDVLHHALRLLK